MKKFMPLIAAIAMIALIFVLFKFFPSKKKSPDRSESAKAGRVADSFVLNFTGTTPLSLRDCVKKYTTALSFTGTDNVSLKYSALVKEKLLPALSKHPDVVWFNFEKKEGFFTVTEATGKVAEKYRMPARQLPVSYDFKDMPAVVIVDRSGVIKLIYVGYSPTIVEDVLSSLGK